ncbi:MAG TPA: PKD domain-containing protein, partial [Vicinamibacterales bacterium]
MISSNLVRRNLALAVLALPLVAAAGCGIEQQIAPALAGPSEFGLSITLTAIPDAVPRDGGSQSVITVMAKDTGGNPVAGQRVTLGMTPANGGTLSASEGVTGQDGRATVEFTAPPPNVTVDAVTISAMPVGQNADNAVPRTMSIRLRGPAAPSAAFVFSPSTPEQLQLVTFDATGTTINGSVCGDECTYAWKFGTETTATGRVATHRFEYVGTHTVQLTVTSPAGPSATFTQAVPVSAGTLTPAIHMSPTDPTPYTTVIFDARGTTSSAGATIVEYRWDFGNGKTGSGATATTS